MHSDHVYRPERGSHRITGGRPQSPHLPDAPMAPPNPQLIPLHGVIPVAFPELVEPVLVICRGE
jgi:hypothetical protein